MQEHEHFLELCAVASIGQITGAELSELREHLSWCSTCKHRYSEFLAINAAQHAVNAHSGELTPELAVSAINSDLLHERFLTKAKASGIVFSRARVDRLIPEPARTRHLQTWPMLARTAAALIVAAIAGVGGYYAGTLHKTTALIRQTNNVASTPVSVNTVDRAALTRLEAKNRTLTVEILKLGAALKSEESMLADANAKLSEAQASSVASERVQLKLMASVREHEDRIGDLQMHLDQAQARGANAQEEYEKALASLGSNETQHLEDVARIRELSDQLAERSSELARERDLLAAGRDVRELMSARNLHIVDVFDTDPRGKTRPAFGRIFFTEGKSLLFYAYDMPDARLKNAGYQYRIWGTKEGSSQRARSLGIFYHDDKAQRRWVFHYDDPRVLNEIDSVFVTSEPPSGPANQPQGDKLLYAYLKGQPNHP